MTHQPIIRAEYENALHDLVGSKADKLFPNTPIEVFIDFTDKENRKTREMERFWHFTFYCEGEWIANEYAIDGALARIAETIKVNRDAWFMPCGYMNPEWERWPHINMSNMLTLIGATLL